MANRTAKFETNKGSFTAELYEDKAPRTAGNFIDLAKKGYYDGLKFHRVIPGYTIPDEFHPSLQHDTPGILSMANAGPNTGGSQFFVTVAATPWLDRKHAIFGKVVDGYDVVESISRAKRDARDKPVEDVVMEKVTIEEAAA